MTYTFTCPLTGCGIVMTSHAASAEAAGADLVAQAKNHLATIHPDIKKTDEEVNTDIHTHMIKIEE